MSPALITLTVVKGPLTGSEYEVREPATYVLGRSEECYPRLPDDILHKDISRHHCLLSINPPDLWIQDLGSKNGTYVNGERVGQRKGQPPADEEPQAHAGQRRRLQDGDEIALGHNTVLRVGVHVLQEVG
ncbi:MAG: FHA domain-containing protein [Gemmataceae bacterium]|nr:FHA domain-containing protein [Gemmataceae bacterium]